MASLPPAPSLPLLGRAQDRETLARLLSEARQVDLVGPAGIGKSALALAVAREVAAAGQRVAWLDGVRDLVGQPSLAVIDGGDGEAPAVADVLRRAPEARVLRVARDAPRGEAAARLELGPLDEAAGVALLTRLLARDVPGPRASEPAWALAQIVESLDGVPLALVYVAPFVARLGAAVVAERAHEAPFLLLADALADAPAHHRSVARLFASSLGALPPGERTLLAEVGVFGGPFTPAQVDLVLGGASAMRTATLGVLARRGLLRVVVGGLASWALVRAALATEGPSDATRKRYAAFVRARAARDETLALVPDLARVAAGKDAQAAFEAAVLLGERAPGAVDGALAARLAPPAGASATWRARAARVRGRHAAQQGDWEKARRALSEALREAPPGLHAHLLCDLARGDPTEARALYARAAAGFRAVGDPRGEARVLGHVATLDLSEGALVSARRRFAEAAEAARRAGDLRLEGQVRQNLGLTLLEAGAHAEADAAFSDAIALHEEAGDVRYQGIAALDRGLLRLAEARPRAALRLFDRAADAAEATADPESRALALAAAAEALAALAERRAAERRLRQAHAASRGFAEARLVIGVARGHLELLAARDAWVAERDGGAYAEALSAADASLERADAARSGEQGRLAVGRLARAAELTRALDETLLVAADGRWCRPPRGPELDLRRSPVLAAALLALVGARQDAGGGASRVALQAAIWPGERMSAASARNRLDVAVSKLRQKGLEPCITTDAAAYGLTGPLLSVPSR